MLITKNSILSQLPLFIAEDPYIKSILLSKENEFKTLDDFREDILKQLKVDTATWGLILWEKALGLSSPDTLGAKVVIEESDPILKYYGNWITTNLRDEDPNFEANKKESNGIIKYCGANDRNTWLEFTFYGTGFELIRSSAMFEKARCEIFVDEERFDVNNIVASNPIYNHKIFSKQNLYWGLHTVRIVPYGVSSGTGREDSFVLDRIEIKNDLAQEYDNRRAIIKAKLVPINVITNDTVKDIAKSYGFNNIVIDESEPFVYKLDFDHNANVDYSLRKKMLNDLEELLPAHIELDNKFFISTFYDIFNHLLTWDQANATYVFYDFLTKNKPDPVDTFTYLNKYLDQSVFNYKRFNNDTNLIDSLYTSNVVNNMHDYNKVKNVNLTYVGVTGIPAKMTDVNKKLLSDSKRNLLSRLTDKTLVENKNITTLINNFTISRDRLKYSVNNHPFLKSRGTNVTSNEISAILAPVAKFIDGSGLLSATVSDPLEIVEGKVGFNGINYITGKLPKIDIADFYKNISKYPNGYKRSKVAVTETYVIERQYDLLPENVRRGFKIFNTLGTFDVIPNDYNRGDILFKWQLQDNGDNFKILS